MQAKLSVVALSVAAALAMTACGNKEEPKPAAAPAAPAAPAATPAIVVKLGHVAPMTGPQAHLGKDNESGARLSGVFPAEQHEDWVRNAAHIRRLAKLAERVAELEKKLKENDTRG